MDLDRRWFLRTFSAGGAGALFAGCMGDDTDGDGTRTTDTGDGTDAEDGDDTGDGDGSDGDEDDSRGEIEEDPLADRPAVEPTDVIELTAGGEDLGPETDHGHIYYDEVSGDFDVSVRCLHVGGSTGWEKAGIMVRESLHPRAPHLMIRREPAESDYAASPAVIQWRTEQGEDTEPIYDLRADWLRITRDGDQLTVYGSMTGEEWEQFASFSAEEVPLGEEAIVGLAATGIERHDEEAITATFAHLEGLSPTDNQDLGRPRAEGDVTLRDDLPVVSTAGPLVASGELALVGSVALPEGIDAADCYFEYRRGIQDDWQTTEPETLDSSGWFSATIEADSRRIYGMRAVADVPGAPDPAVGTATDGSILFRGTPSAAAPADHEAPDTSLSPGVAEVGLADGFAEPAPWLDDDTPVVTITEPSREQLDRAARIPHERLVVFETSGVIDLDREELSVRTDKCYIAGQTAPSPGITLVREGFQIAADDCVLQHLRVRSGDANEQGSFAPTSILVQDGRQNNVVDHCTTTWGVDENLSIGGETRDITYTNNLVAEALRNSTHPKGAHSMGSLILPEAENVALLGNVWTRNVDRNPRLRLASMNVVANNLTYHYRDGCWMDPQTRASIVGNQYLGPVSGQSNILTKSLDYGEGIPKAYVADNYTDEGVSMVGSDVEELDERPLWPEGFEAMPVDDVFEHNLDNAGARPAERTEHDERVLRHVRDRTGDFIDSQRDVGGYPDLEENTRELDVPETGTREWLREQSRQVEEGS